MAKTDEQLHYDCMHRFIAVANEMMEEDTPRRVVAASLMTASCVFASYEVGGNSGRLDDAAINNIVAAYRQQLQRVQDHRNEESGQPRSEEVKQTVDRIVSFPDDN